MSDGRRHRMKSTPGLVVGLVLLASISLVIGGCPITNPSGACCAGDGSCTVTTQAACTGTWLGANTTCSPNNCTQPTTGACCSATGTCTVTTQAACTGTWQGASTTCTSTTCVTTGNSGLTGKYVGSAKCGECHQDTHTKWAATLHSDALDALEAIGQGSNTACIGCHTVGYGQAGGFTSRALTNDLAGVGCEACHGAARDHISNITDLTKLPKIDINSDVCGVCHQGEHHPNFEDWEESGHATMAKSEAIFEEDFAAGTQLTTCGKCHSGDYIYLAILGGNTTYTVGAYPGHPITIGNDYLKGKDPADMVKVSCAICHDPHMKTSNASNPTEGRDYQLRWAETKAVSPTNTVAATTDPTRFNICGQCHHARERTWWQTSSSTREPHPSNQVNFYFGEMPMDPADPDGGAPLVPSRVHVHVSAANQCVTCHVYRKDAVEGIAPAVSGHTFEPNFAGCATSGCHPTEATGQTLYTAMKAETEGRLTQLKSHLDAWSTAHSLGWNYSSQPGGPGYTDPVTGVKVPGSQSKIPEEIQKARFLYFYVLGGSGDGVHNPGYMRDCMNTAELLVATDPAPLP